VTGLDSTELIIGERPQYFFDSGLIEEIQNIRRTVHLPIQLERNPVLELDRPWEHFTNFGADDWALWQDDDGDFHCLYTDMALDREKLAREGGTLIDWHISRFRVMYARSPDGLNWEKPAMGIVHEGGHDTNIVFGSETYGNVWGPAVLDDPLEEDPARRYKMLYELGPPGFRVADETPGAHIRMAYSPDGVHWTPADEVPRFGSLGDRLGDTIFPTFDPESGVYRIVTRHPLMELAPRTRPTHAPMVGAAPSFDAVMATPNRRVVRRIFMCESRDFVNWSEPRLILAPDPNLDNLDVAFYGMRPFRLGGHWIGFLGVFHQVSNTSKVELVHSRDGRQWERLAPTHDWIGLGEPGSWCANQIGIPRILGVGDEETWVYFGGATSQHDLWYAEGQEEPDDASAGAAKNPRYALGIGKLRRDGFVSVGAGGMREGLVATQPFVSEGDRLVINAACGAGGYLKVEVRDATDGVLPGRGLEDADIFTGDSVRHTVTWQGDASLPLPLNVDSGTVYTRFIPHRRLRFVMKNAELYSFAIERSGG